MISELAWTREAPTEPGWHWMRLDMGKGEFHHEAFKLLVWDRDFGEYVELHGQLVALFVSTSRPRPWPCLNSFHEFWPVPIALPEKTK